VGLCFYRRVVPVAKPAVSKGPGRKKKDIGTGRGDAYRRRGKEELAATIRVQEEKKKIVEGGKGKETCGACHVVGGTAIRRRWGAKKRDDSLSIPMKRYLFSKKVSDRGRDTRTEGPPLFSRKGGRAQRSRVGARGKGGGREGVEML